MMEVLMSLTGPQVPQTWLQLWEPLGSILVSAEPQTIQQIISALNHVCEEISREHAHPDMSGVHYRYMGATL